jgi:hypothetical protein
MYVGFFSLDMDSVTHAVTKHFIHFYNLLKVASWLDHHSLPDYCSLVSINPAFISVVEIFQPPLTRNDHFVALLTYIVNHEQYLPLRVLNTVTLALEQMQ